LSAAILACQPWLAAAQLEPPSQVHPEMVPPRAPSTIRWWHGAVVLGGISALMLLDQPAQRFFQNRRSVHSDDMSGTLRHFGQVEVFGTITAGLVTAGLLSGDDDLTRAGGRLAATLALAGAASSVTKLALGRPRPNQSSDADGFAPFSGQDAMPSGHTTVAFALATALSDDINRTWASVGLYTLATGVGWSRINDNRHWLSDVVAGAALGVTSAKLMNGRWRIFNLSPPRVLLGPGHAGLAWQVSF
jgi:membrane-associated phospholipid phosphatase